MAEEKGNAAILTPPAVSVEYSDSGYDTGPFEIKEMDTGKLNTGIVEDESGTLRETNQLNSDFPSRGARVIGFVEAIEKENQYFEFKDYLQQNVQHLAHNSDKLKIFKRLVRHKRVQDIYTKLDFQDILDAVQEHIRRVPIEEYCRGCKLEQGKNCISTYLEEYDQRFPLLPIIVGNGRFHDKDLFLNLVYHIRERGYVMNEDPLVELDVIKKYNSFFYHHSFIGGLVAAYSEKSVVVYNVPNKFKENTIKESFSACGEIDSIELEQCGDMSKIAYVTFKDPEGAKLAPILKGLSYFYVVPMGEMNPKRDCESYSSTELMEAHKKYQEFRRYPKKSWEERAILCPHQKNKKKKKAATSMDQTEAALGDLVLLSDGRWFRPPYQYEMNM